MDSPPFVITIAQGLPPAGSHTVVPVAPLLPLPLAVRLLVSRGRGGDVADLNAFQVEFWTDLRGRGGDDWACEATLRPVACETVEGEEGAPGAASFAVTFAGELDLSAAGTRGRAEFAYRARPSQCAGWTWSGKGPQDNGVLTLLRCDEEPRPLEKTLALEASFAWERLFVPGDVQIGVLRGPSGPLNAGRVRRACRVVGAVRSMRLERASVFWLAPRTRLHGDSGHDSLLYLAMLDDSSYLVLLSLPTMPSASGMCMRGDEVYLQSSPDGPACVMAAKGSDLMRVIESACNCALGQVLAPEEGTMLIAASAISGSNSASDTRFPGGGCRILDGLGWCTWNAFYDKVSLNLILSALDWFAQAGTRFEWILIDDGWLQTDGDRKLTSFEAEDSRFPGGLEVALSTIRQRHPYIRHIGVWHTVWGYWNGISPNSRIAEDFCVVEKTTSDQRTVHLVETRVLRFYDEWYRMLRRSGVDFVKVDAQASFELLSGEDRALGSAYRAALRESARKHMGGNVIYCMAHTPGVLWGCSPRRDGALRNAVLRNSDDFFPDVDESHGWHVYANAANSLFTRSLGWPALDWDMFQSKHPRGRFHAIARAVSGGPVYLSDNIATHDPRAVTPLLPGGPCSRVLRSRQPAAVCVDSLFEDPTKVDVILKIAARNTEKLAVVAAFNCRPDSELLGAVTICEAFSGILPTGQVFAAYDFKDRTVIHLRRPNCTARAASPALRALTSFVPVFLSARDANVFTFSVVEYPPLSSQRRKIPGICSFGLAGKYNGSAAVLGTEWNAAKDGRFGSRYRYGVKLLRCAGRVAVHLDFRTFDVPETLGPDGIPACVRAATVDGEDVRAAVEYDRRQSILVFASIAGRPELNDLEIQVEVFLG